MRALEEKSFLLLVLAVSLVLIWIISPFFGAILWAVVVAILFDPMQQKLLRRWPEKSTRAALVTLLTVLAVVVIPLILLTMFVLQEVVSVYTLIQSGQIDFNHYFEQFQSVLPQWASNLLDRFGLSNLPAVRDKLSAGITSRFQTLAAQAFTIGQQAFGFTLALGVMLYLTFFLLRDGRPLADKFDRAIPLKTEHRRALFHQFVTVVRATIKGSLVVAIVQGLIGGVTFWALGIHAAVLWGVAMGLFSLLPAIGTGLVWVPVAAYLLISGELVHGLILIFCGVFIIGMVDNVLRPILVGRDTSMPDYVVLISTLGGIEIFGFSGFVIGPVMAALFMAVWNIFARIRMEEREPV
ncbi:AI-2E family transporter [Sphingomonas montanisoli]|uniref:AI-2E family transporter n=1 Tax=Sphingomonas montanisoli TaxID=2606412 RepID=A0A5D9C0Q3_9SPHN|nr:AI-2E family transporter [Sphingomonas montanisoli]TZG24600.1 AI-2E family transporter [Sphingomonas montanisoli]